MAVTHAVERVEAPAGKHENRAWQRAEGNEQQERAAAGSGCRAKFRFG